MEVHLIVLAIVASVFIAFYIYAMKQGSKMYFETQVNFTPEQIKKMRDVFVRREVPVAEVLAVHLSQASTGALRSMTTGAVLHRLRKDCTNPRYKKCMHVYRDALKEAIALLFIMLKEEVHKENTKSRI
jgi:hypothetical protein